MTGKITETFDAICQQIRAEGATPDTCMIIMLINRGMEPIDALGRPFDPVVHEAVGVEERDDVDANQVIDVLQDGFMLKGRLLRPAMVRVSRAKS